MHTVYIYLKWNTSGGVADSNPTNAFGHPFSKPKEKKISLYMASFQFDARNADELSFVEGDVIEVDMNAPAEPEWFYGSCKGRSGLFPQAYVAPYSDDNTPSPFIPVPQATTQSIPANVEVLQGRFHIII